MWSGSLKPDQGLCTSFPWINHYCEFPFLWQLVEYIIWYPVVEWFSCSYFIRVGRVHANANLILLCFSLFSNIMKLLIHGLAWPTGLVTHTAFISDSFHLKSTCGQIGQAWHMSPLMGSFGPY